MDLDNYKTEVTIHLQEAWELARKNIKVAQTRQKRNYDKNTRTPTFRVGERVFLHKPSLRTGPAYKFARPFEGPYRIVAMENNVADIRKVDHPKTTTIRVAVSRLRHCPFEIESEDCDDTTTDEHSYDHDAIGETDPKQNQEVGTKEYSRLPAPPNESTSLEDTTNTQWSGRLRKRKVRPVGVDHS